MWLSFSSFWVSAYRSIDRTFYAPLCLLLSVICRSKCRQSERARSNGDSEHNLYDVRLLYYLIIVVNPPLRQNTPLSVEMRRIEVHSSCSASSRAKTARCGVFRLFFFHRDE